MGPPRRARAKLSRRPLRLRPRPVRILASAATTSWPSEWRSVRPPGSSTTARARRCFFPARRYPSAARAAGFPGQQRRRARRVRRPRLRAMGANVGTQHDTAAVARTSSPVPGASGTFWFGPFPRRSRRSPAYPTSWGKPAGAGSTWRLRTSRRRGRRRSPGCRWRRGRRCRPWRSARPRTGAPPGRRWPIVQIARAAVRRRTGVVAGRAAQRIRAGAPAPTRSAAVSAASAAARTRATCRGRSGSSCRSRTVRRARGPSARQRAGRTQAAVGNRYGTTGDGRAATGSPRPPSRPRSWPGGSTSAASWTARIAGVPRARSRRWVSAPHGGERVQRMTVARSGTSVPASQTPSQTSPSGSWP